MSVESGNTINDLDSLFPLSGDSLIEGDNHLRLIKSILKAQFPGLGGQGFASPIAASEAEIDFSVGVTSSIQAQLNAITSSDALKAPAGTVMSFFQSSAPTGWVQKVSSNDAMLRVVSGPGGGSGGNSSPITFSHSHTTPSHTLTLSQMPAHNHQHGYDSKDNTGTQQAGAVKFGRVGDDGNASAIAWCTTNSKGSGASHSHGNTNTKTFTPKFINVINATKS